MDWGSLAGTLGSAIGSLFNKGGSSGGSGSVPLGGQAGNGFNVGSGSQAAMQQASSNGSGSSGGFGNILGGLGSMFGGSGGSSGSGGSNSLFNSNILGGIGGMFGSQLVGNPKTPALPQSLVNFQNQATSGGSPLQQQANQYNSTLLSGQNTAANDAATHSLDLNYQEQVRQLNGMYKSLRPGTDPTSDTTYQRDLNNLNDQYTRQKAGVLAQQQQGAAQYGLQSGAENANEQLAAIQPELQKQYEDWAAQYQQDATLRNSLMSLFGNQATGSIFKNMFSSN